MKELENLYRIKNDKLVPDLISNISNITSIQLEDTKIIIGGYYDLDIINECIKYTNFHIKEIVNDVDPLYICSNLDNKNQLTSLFEDLKSWQLY